MSSRVSLANGAAVLVAIGLALVAAGYRAPAPPLRARSLPAASVDVVELPGGKRALRDATGHLVELKRYRRILAASLVADRLLHALAEPDRVAGVTTHGRARSPWAYQQADKPALSGIDDVEAVVALAPDLVVASSLSNPAKVARLREHGIEVFDLGPMRGASWLVQDIHEVAHLLGHPERGHRLAAAWQRRFAAVADALDNRPRKRAVFLTTYGGTVFGGTRGTSYGDVLVAAGLVDAAASAYEGWPQYSAEQLLRLDPDVVVTKPGMGHALCRMAGLDALRVCQHPAGFIEIEAGLLDDPGLGMLDAAEQVFAAAYPEHVATRAPAARPSIP